MNNQHKKLNIQPIAFLDSGIGGLPYLKWIRDKVPQEAYIYLADRRNFPYGEKPAERIIDHVVHAVAMLEKRFSPKIFVIACNTASVLALSVLRKTFNVPFVGVVPAVKPAAENTHNKKIGVIGSNRTVQDAYTENLISSFAGDCKVFPISAGPVIDFVENNFLAAGDEEKKNCIAPVMGVCAQNGIDTLVLGCTHFLFLEDEFKGAAGGHMRIIDSREGVGKQVIRLLEENGFNNGRNKTGQLFHTGDSEETGIYERFARLFGLEYKGTLDP